MGTYRSPVYRVNVKPNSRTQQAPDPISNLLRADTCRSGVQIPRFPFFIYFLNLIHKSFA